jgi:superfamily I DNA/RNA helicase/mRNA-degrading endonuclease YafQ of YafQ-DinJ toxin-antitoxin module
MVQLSSAEVGLCVITSAFKDGFDALPDQVQRKVVKAIRLLINNPRYPGLNSHPVQSARHSGVWESYVDRGHRLLWERAAGQIYLWRVGPHAVIDEARHLHAPVTAEPSPRIASVQPESSHKGDQPYTRGAAVGATPHQTTALARFQPTVLQLLGVPEAKIRAVQQISDPEELWDLDLDSTVQSTLYDILSNPHIPLDDVLFDPARLLYRATADQLAGYAEGRIKRLLLNLEPEQRRYVEIRTRGPYLLRGVAGSGKTTIGIYRAKARADERDLFRVGGRVLYLTYNRTLAQAVADLFAELYGALPDGVCVSTVDAWMREFCIDRGHQLAINQERAMAILYLAIKAVQEYRREPVLLRPPPFFMDEISIVIKGRGLASLDEYLQIERTGTGSALAPSARAAVWAVYEAYEQGLSREGLIDFAGVRLLALRELERDPADRYDEVVVDEAQDLVPVQLRAVRLLAAGESIFLLADAAQSIYYRGVSWRDAGMAVAGRTRVLRTNYRNTTEVLNAAAALISRSPALVESGEFTPPEATRRRGPRPCLVICSSTRDQSRFVAEQILRLCVGTQARRYRPGDMAVLAPTYAWCREVRDELLNRGIPNRLHQQGDQFAVLENEVKIITIHSAKGLEFPIVFVTGLVESHALGRYFPREPEQGASESEQAAVLDEDRRLLYVAMTRAADRLYLLTTKGQQSRLLDELEPASVVRQTSV